MATTVFTDGTTLTAASWFNDVDGAGYSVLSSVAGTNTITATGPANYTLSATRAPVFFIPAVTNTGATTIAITPSGGSALTAKNIFWNGGACIGGELRGGVPVAIVYDGTQFNIVGNGSAIPVGLINAAGDLLQGSSADVIARLALGAGGARLHSTGSAAEWQATWFKVGSFTRDVSTASGAQAITGVGFRPKAVFFIMSSSGSGAYSLGFSDASGGGSIIFTGPAPDTSNALGIDQGGSNTYYGGVPSLDADGFTVTWTKGGSPTGTYTINYLALR